MALFTLPSQAFRLPPPCLPSPCVCMDLYGSLNDFLARGAERETRVELREPAAVKDVIEARGVPHPGVALILVDGESVPFEHRIRGGDPDDASLAECSHRAVSSVGG